MKMARLPPHIHMGNTRLGLPAQPFSRLDGVSPSIFRVSCNFADVRMFCISGIHDLQLGTLWEALFQWRLIRESVINLVAHDHQRLRGLREVFLFFLSGCPWLYFFIVYRRQPATNDIYLISFATQNNKHFRMRAPRINPIGETARNITTKLHGITNNAQIPYALRRQVGNRYLTETGHKRGKIQVSPTAQILAHLGYFTLRIQSCIRQQPNSLCRLAGQNSEQLKHGCLPLPAHNLVMPNWEVSCSDNCSNRPKCLNPSRGPRAIPRQAKQAIHQHNKYWRNKKGLNYISERKSNPEFPIEHMAPFVQSNRERLPSSLTPAQRGAL